ncbi:MAG: DUF7686 domain-containing protein [bacterium]
MGPDGVSHTFEIESILCPTGHLMTAREVKDGGDGYEFRILGDFEAEALDLFGRLYERIRAGLAERSLERRDGLWRPSRDDRFSGRITHDPEDTGLPVVVVDGCPFTWETLGQMLVDYEGFNLEIRITDSIVVIGWAPRRRRAAQSSMKSRRGHFCWRCRRLRANECFTGAGHSRHVCRDCERAARAARGQAAARPSHHTSAQAADDGNQGEARGSTPEAIDG